MSSTHLQPGTLLVVLLLVLLAVALFGWWRERSRLGRANRRRSRAGLRAEAEAEELLRGHGFEIRERQARVPWRLYVDGEAVDVWSQVDLLVERDDRLYLADVKTGADAPSPSSPATRRQLLEYQLVFAVDGVLLVDMVARRILRVDFGDLLRRA